MLSNDCLQSSNYHKGHNLTTQTKKEVAVITEYTIKFPRATHVPTLEIVKVSTYHIVF